MGSVGFEGGGKGIDPTGERYPLGIGGMIPRMWRRRNPRHTHTKKKERERGISGTLLFFLHTRTKEGIRFPVSGKEMGRREEEEGNPGSNRNHRNHLYPYGFRVGFLPSFFFYIRVWNSREIRKGRESSSFVGWLEHMVGGDPTTVEKKKTYRWIRRWRGRGRLVDGGAHARRRVERRTERVRSAPCVLPCR